MNGDGIVIYELSNGLMENNVVYDSGKCTTCSASSPVGLWTWNTNTTTAQFNESYFNHSWEGDGGGYDVDGDNVNNTYQYNYAHDNDGYCFAIYDFGAAASTINPLFRYNICANDAQKLSYGEVKIAAWQGGELDSVQIYNNTFYYNPAPISFGGGTEAIDANASYIGNSFFMNNIVYSTYPRMIFIGTGTLVFDYNLYYTPPGVGYEFKRLSQVYTSLSAWQSATGKDPHSISADPLLNGLGNHDVGMPNLTNNYYTLQPGSPALSAGTNVCAVSCIGGSMGARDFFGNALGSTHNMGAYEGPGR
jgi:acetyltransferase-like isoleucine patch superfamily enzyme